MSGDDTVASLLNRHPHLTSARQLAEARIAEAKALLLNHRVEGFDIVAFGSLARRELTEESDFDYLVLSTRMPSSPNDAVDLLRRADDLRHQWATEVGRTNEGPKPVAGPGSSGVFARAVGAFDLVHQIGLQDDTNHTLTRRMLLLEESVSLLDSTVHTQVIEATLRRYLDLGHTDQSKVPRFLLNDVTRYWHTITVDYQAKAREGPEDSGLRYLKLIIPRKILFAGTVMSLLLCGLDGAHLATSDDLLRQFQLTPLERLIQGYDLATPAVRSAMEGVVGIVDVFLQHSGDQRWRDVVKRASKSDPCDEFTEMYSRADELQEHLETIFFGWELITARARRTLVF